MPDFPNDSIPPYKPSWRYRLIPWLGVLAPSLVVASLVSLALMLQAAKDDAVHAQRALDRCMQELHAK